jgi:tRNA-2-methylthio-N6-dimethylallyladenosine synthase
MSKEKIYIETFGCQMNTADTERVAAIINSSGYEITSEVEQAGVVLLNTCSVRERAEQKVFSRMGEIQQSSNKREQLFGIMGCVAQLEGETLFDRNPHLNLVVGTRAFDRLPALIEQAQSGQRRVSDIGERQGAEAPQISPDERHSRWIAFIPIIEGCNKFCTYCIVPYSRGREQSRPPYVIVNEVKKLLRDGYQEVQLIGQNVNSYRPKTEEGLEGFRGATYFSRLLRAVAATGMPRIKFTTSFPRDFHPDIISAMDENDNLCNWIHLPVQSGSDRVLKTMRRGYSVDNYLRRIETIKNAKRKYALTTDIIIGFPGESEDDFNATLRLVEKCQYHSLYIFKYSERPHTRAEKLDDDVDKNEKSRRFKILEDVQKAIQKKIFSGYVNREVSVLVEGISARLKTDLTGHTTCNKVVNFPGDEHYIGKILSVRVADAKSHTLYGAVSAHQ